MAGILDGKVALITGAGSGIGQATSRIFAREGAKLVLADVVEEGGNRTLKMVQDLGAQAIFLKCDVAKSRKMAWAPRYWTILRDRKSTRLNSSHTVISYAVFCSKKKKHGQV